MLNYILNYSIWNLVGTKKYLMPPPHISFFFHRPPRHIIEIYEDIGISNRIAHVILLWRKCTINSLMFIDNYGSDCWCVVEYNNFWSWVRIFYHLQYTENQILKRRRILNQFQKLLYVVISIYIYHVCWTSLSVPQGIYMQAISLPSPVRENKTAKTLFSIMWYFFCSELHINSLFMFMWLRFGTKIQCL